MFNDPSIASATMMPYQARRIFRLFLFFFVLFMEKLYFVCAQSQSVIIISEASKAHRIEYAVVALSIYRVVFRKAIDRIPMTNYIASTPNNNIITMKQFFTCRPNDTFHQQQSQSNRTRWE